MNMKEIDEAIKGNFTPKPWRDSKDGRVRGPHGVTVAYCGEGTVVGVDGSYSISSHEAYSNAALVAVAPELADAYREQQESINRVVQLLDDAVGLLHNHEQHDDPLWKREYEELCKKYDEATW